MTPQIRPFASDDNEAVVQLSLLAWEPVFASFRQLFGPAVFARLYPDWQKQQREVVEKFCQGGEHTSAWVAEVEGVIAGFIVYALNDAEKMGVVELLAVHPEYQHRGVATSLNTFALDQMRASGMTMASLQTGGDPGHAPARKAYEKAGYRAFPTVWYYQLL
jgi:GNAT superfamily N-acetyltransferase